MKAVVLSKGNRNSNIENGSLLSEKNHISVAIIPQKNVKHFNWIYMQGDLEAELLTRQMFYKAQEKDGNKRELKKLLNELLDLNSLHAQKDCLHM